ncbi:MULTISPECIES: ABC transporter permease [Streptomyces]|uniref:ABC transporter permease n=2 Tax=Streptomyces TaxID=1883 RepID=A0A100Y8G2_9ACTN|nr:MULTISPECIES: ABC transporter permease subunit [Streptomyces]KUH39579.1 ABC transporter permease [Streptomyces kanasensis]UUS34092.1 ABC transporter permease subunit [Streptomyces changanensis]
MKPSKRRPGPLGALGASLGAVLVALPLGVAVLGPLFADAPAPGLAAPYAARDVEHLLGTDALGRDVLALLLHGGRSALGMALGAVALAYLVGGLAGLLAASARRRWLDELLIRPLDVLLPLPTLLVISVVAVGWRGSPVAIALAVAAVNVPPVARLVRAAALDAASGPVAEALRLQGESWARVQFGLVARSALAPVAADIGTRVTLAVFLVGSANFLGLGLDPTAPDWAVSIARGREGLLLQPWAVLAPAAMLVLFTVGLNLFADRLLARSRHRTQEAVR